MLLWQEGRDSVTRNTQGRDTRSKTQTAVRNKTQTAVRLLLRREGLGKGYYATQDYGLLRDTRCGKRDGWVRDGAEGRRGSGGDGAGGVRAGTPPGRGCRMRWGRVDTDAAGGLLVVPAAAG